MNPTPLTNDEIFQQLNTKATETGVDSWSFKIFRRTALGAPMRHVATLAEAKVQHAVDAYEWLAMLGGGGPQYVIECFHVQDPTHWVGGRLMFNIDGDPKNVIDPLVVTLPNWRGPLKTKWPSLDGPTPTSYGSGQLSQVGAPQGNLAPNANAQSGAASIHDPRIDQVLHRLELKEREFEDARRKTEIDAADRRAAEREREAERRAAVKEQELRMEIERLKMAQAQPQKPQLTFAETMAGVAAAMAPFLAQWQQSRQLDAEERRRQFEESQKRSDMLLQAIMQKPLIDPAVEKLLGRRDDSGDVMLKTTEALSKMAMTNMRVMGTVAEMLQERDPENPGMMILSEVRKGLESVVQAIQPPQPVLRIVEEQPQAAGNGALATSPVQAPVNGGVGPERPPAPPRPASPPAIESFVRRILSLDDAKKLAADFMDAYERNGELQKLVAEVGGDPVVLFRKYVGDDWAVHNQTYALGLVNAIKVEYERRVAMAQSAGNESEDAEVVEED